MLKRARAYLLTDQAVTETAARYATSRPGLDTESQHAIRAANDLRGSTVDGPAGYLQVPGVTYSAGDRSGRAGGRGAVARVVPRAGPGKRRRRAAAPDRDESPDPVPASGGHAKAGRAVQVSRGRWRAVTTEEPPR
jgi:hypothetical protein